MKKGLLEVIKGITTTEDKKEKNDLIKSLLTYKSVDKVNFRSQMYKWNYSQLQKIYTKCVQEYSNEKNNEGNIRVKRKYLEIEEIYDVMIECILDLKEKKFQFRGEGQLMSYLKKRIFGLCSNKLEELNKVWYENNCTIESLEEIIEKDNEDEDDSELWRIGKYDGYEELFNIEFNYNKNKNKRYIKDDDENTYYIYLSWAKLFWDDETILSDKLLEIRHTYIEELMKEFKKWRIWTTSNQREKIEKLIVEIEQDNDILKYTNKGYKLNLKKVGEILFSYKRKSNSNKDIYDFQKSLKTRFKKYLRDTNKSYLLKELDF